MDSQYDLKKTYNRKPEYELFKEWTLQNSHLTITKYHNGMVTDCLASYFCCCFVFLNRIFNFSLIGDYFGHWLKVDF